MVINSREWILMFKFRRALSIIGACLGIAALAASQSSAQGTMPYNAIVHATVTSASETWSYVVDDYYINGTRHIYLDIYNRTTNLHCYTDKAAGSKITSVEVGYDYAAYKGTIYPGKGKKLCPFELYVFSDHNSPSGYVIRFIMMDSRSGAVVLSRLDMLDTGGTFLFNP
jgi:hypothetical protein